MADDHVKAPHTPLPPGQPPARSEPAAPDRTTADNHPPPDGAPPASPRGLLTGAKEILWSKPPPHPHRQTDSLREIVETVVFVVVLVLLLKSFVAEAFVIPTGSMASTLWGYQKVVACPQCGHEFPVNCSQEVDPQEGGAPVRVTGCICPNCRLAIRLVNPLYDGRQPNPQAGNEVLDPGPNSGDRVLVVKYLYDFGKPERWDVVVFKFPGDTDFPVRGPQQNWVQMNYIKRLISAGDETIGIHYGDLYHLDVEKPAGAESDGSKLDLWRHHYMHENDALDKLEARIGARILQKPPDKILAMKRLVYDNDQPAKDLEGVQPPRWAGVDDDGAWSAIASHGFRHTAPDEKQLRWLRYRHILRSRDKPELITDFLGYNTYEPRKLGQLPAGPNWVGDLILECEVTVEDPKGELVLELSRGVDRFRARWDLASGKCTLLRLKWPHEGSSPPADDDFKDIADANTSLKGKGTYRVRFANVDERLTVWVDGSLPFGDGVSYEPPKQRGPYPNDLQPVSIGVRGGTVSVHHLKLWRDTYYTTVPGQSDSGQMQELWNAMHRGDAERHHELHHFLSDPRRWEPLRELRGKTLYVHPGHYLCLGDNSPESSDGRSWGTVPERLMLGRALLVYYPFYFPYWPLKSPVNRVGAIE
ncbi:MAG TPA: S26 family signal peptidase [Gemmataceae bacterium]|nr:S26 family signal peptidase [Gemmataceae bacterium]